MIPRSRKELFDFIAERESASDQVRLRLLNDAGVSQAYYEGYHWIERGVWPRTSPGTNLRSNYNPDSDQIRVTDNIITPLVLQLRAQTYMEALRVEIEASDRDPSPTAVFTAQVAEDTIKMMVEKSGYLDAARDASNARPVFGSYVIGLTMETSDREMEVDGQMAMMPDRRVMAFADSPHKLVLDPFQPSGNLHLHDEVCWRDIWTYKAAVRKYPKIARVIDEAKCPTVDAIAQGETQIAAETDGRLFANYRRYSKSKAVVVRQCHYKDESGLFSIMCVVVDGMYGTSDGRDSKVWINEDDPVSLFGGDGLPFELIHAHKRIDSPFAMSDVSLVIDDQNRRNLNKTIQVRHLKNFASYMPVIDVRSIGHNDVEKARQAWNNRVGGPIFYKGSKVDGHEPPRLLEFPEPPRALDALAQQEWSQAMEKVGRPPVSTGEQKSHVSYAAQQSSLRQADMPGNVRVSEDVEAHSRLLRTLLGTTIMAVKARSPGVLASMHEEGFVSQDFAALASINPRSIPMKIRVMPSSVRMKSHEIQEDKVFQAAAAGWLTAPDARQILADDLDSPLSASDQFYSRKAQEASLAVMQGEEWEPIPLGEESRWYISAFRRATQDRRVKMDPEAKARLVRAIEAQQQAAAVEAVRMNPELAMNMQGAGQAAQAPAEPTEPAAPVAIADALAAMQAA